MKKVSSVFILSLLCFAFICVNSSAQYITESVPKKDRINSINTVDLTRKVNKAKTLIEKYGEAAFVQFRENEDEWLGQKEALFVVNATDGHQYEGVFIVFPPETSVSKNAMDMKTVNGKHFARKTKEEHSLKKDKISLGFFAGSNGEIPHASTIATTPQGNTYAITSSSHNFHREKLFLTSLVTAACDILAQEGEKAFTLFADPQSAFRFKDSYIYIFDEKQNMLCDPARPEYVGKNICSFPSLFPGYIYPVSAGSLAGVLSLAENNKFPQTAEEYVEMSKKTLFSNGFAWTAYYTPKPGETKMSRKVSYVKTVKSPTGKLYAVGSGVYLVD